MATKKIRISGKEKGTNRGFGSIVEPPSPNITTGEPDRQFIPLAFKPEDIEWCRWTIEGISGSIS